jgi:hypothetical protein
MERFQGNAGSVPLTMHIENAFHPYRPDYVGLHCTAANDHDNVAGLRVTSIRNALPHLPAGPPGARTAEVHHRPRRPPSGTSPRRPRRTRSSPAARTTRDIKIDFYSTYPLDDEARRAVALLDQVLTALRARSSSIRATSLSSTTASHFTPHPVHTPATTATTAGCSASSSSGLPPLPGTPPERRLGPARHHLNSDHLNRTLRARAPKPRALALFCGTRPGTGPSPMADPSCATVINPLTLLPSGRIHPASRDWIELEQDHRGRAGNDLPGGATTSDTLMSDSRTGSDGSTGNRDGGTCCRCGHRQF